MDKKIFYAQTHLLNSENLIHDLLHIFAKFDEHNNVIDIVVEDELFLKQYVLSSKYSSYILSDESIFSKTENGKQYNWDIANKTYIALNQ